MSGWQPIKTAPKDGTRILGRRTKNIASPIGGALFGKAQYETHRTFWGKTSHVPLYGWCHGRVENVDLWNPTHWKPLPQKVSA